MEQYQEAIELISKDQADQARKILLQITETDHEFAPPYYGLGIIQLHLNDMRGAADFFEKSIHYGARDPQIYYLLASALVVVGDFDNAKKAYLEAIQRRPSMANVHHDLGVLYFRTNEFENAEKSLKKAMALDPSSSKSILMLGVVCIKDGKPENALEYVTALRAVGDELKAVHLENLIRESQANKKIQEPDAKLLTPGGASEGNTGKMAITGNAQVNMRGTNKRKAKSPFARH